MKHTLIINSLLLIICISCNSKDKFKSDVCFNSYKILINMEIDDFLKIIPNVKIDNENLNDNNSVNYFTIEDPICIENKIIGRSIYFSIYNKKLQKVQVQYFVQNEDDISPIKIVANDFTCLQSLDINKPVVFNGNVYSLSKSKTRTLNVICVEIKQFGNE